MTGDLGTDIELILVILGVAAFFWRLDSLLRQLILSVKTMDNHQASEHEKFVDALDDIADTLSRISHRIVEVDTKLEAHIRDESLHRSMK